MYAFPEMINIGLKEGQEFPSEDHKTVAQNIGLCNSNVHDATTLTEIVQSVIRVPADRIRTVTILELFEEFDCPEVW